MIRSCGTEKNGLSTYIIIDIKNNDNPDVVKYKIIVLFINIVLCILVTTKV